MKTLPSFDEISALLAYDPATGVLRWRVNCRGTVRAGNVAGCQYSNGYVMVSVLGRRFLAHRLAWLLATGAWPNSEIDHLDGDRANNRISNLRDVSHLTNMQNRRMANSDNTSGFLGASPYKGRWKAQIKIVGKVRYLGMFDSPEAAHAAYIEAKRKLHPGCVI
ncbi:HNH endonuclease [Achromobacter spanius]|uniref:HNH endonuclease n=1 Tax=Achromobacter spanius TaxID=217203 RepID=UPI000F8F928E|nr:HNH endonuclease [Achromobacter spanius]AZS78768.1 HNH endonuclease [Achromobacter spanius]